MSEKPEPDYVPSSRSERYVAIARVLVAVSLLLVRPTRFLASFHVLLALFIFYTLVSVVLAFRAPAVPPWWRALTHLFDLLVAGAAMFLSDQTQIDPVLLLSFPILAAAQRFHPRYAAWTALAAFVVVSLVRPPSPADGSSVMLHAVRICWILALSTLSLSVAIQQRRLQLELSQLAAWPRALIPGSKTLVHDMLERSAEVLGAPRMILMWEEREEPWVHLAWWFRGEFGWSREAPTRYPKLTADALDHASFLTRDSTAKSPLVIVKTASGISTWRGAPLSEDFRDRFEIVSLLSVPLTGETFQGRLFMLDDSNLSTDDFTIGEIASGLLASTMDQYFLLKQSQEVAIREERIRLARELHDGLLQSFTGVVLQLEAVHHTLRDDPEGALKRVTEAQGVIMADQRELRAFIQDLRPTSVQSVALTLSDRLEDLKERIERQWGIRLELVMEGSEEGFSSAFRQQVSSLVNEAVLNAAKHAEAKEVELRLDAGEHLLSIRVKDDGKGFPFMGSYTLAELNERNVGPGTLKERVAMLAGELTIDSSRAGTILEMRVPIDRAGAERGNPNIAR